VLSVRNRVRQIRGDKLVLPPGRIQFVFELIPTYVYILMGDVDSRRGR